MKPYRKYIAYTLAISLFPALALAMPSTFKDFIFYIISLIYIVIPILFALTFIVFFWGLSKFIINSSGNAAELQKGKNYMLWGIIILFVLLSFRSILTLVTNDLGVGDSKTLPLLPTN